MVIIDGHNALFRLYPDVDADFLRAVRELTERALVLAEKSARKNILVFDGSGGLHELGGRQKRGACLEIVYSGIHWSADEWISSWMLQHPDQAVTIVSDDKKMVAAVRRKNMKSLTPARWFLREEKTPPPAGKREFGSVDYWLEEFGEA